MKKSELIKQLEAIEGDLEVYGLDIRKSLFHDDGDGTGEGLYDLKVEQQEQGDEGHPPFIMLTFANDDYLVGGEPNLDSLLADKIRAEEWDVLGTTGETLREYPKPPELKHKKDDEPTPIITLLYTDAVNSKLEVGDKQLLLDFVNQPRELWHISDFDGNPKVLTVDVSAHTDGIVIGYEQDSCDSKYYYVSVHHPLPEYQDKRLLEYIQANTFSSLFHNTIGF